MGIGMKELLVILLLVLLIFGAKKLKTIGADLGSAVRGFKKSMSDGENEGDEDKKQDLKQIRSDQPDAEFADATKASKSEKKDHAA
jgi:sec-independent protein translocase protein TatA